MRGWTVAMAAAAVLVGTGAGAFPVQVLAGARGEAPDVAALREELARKDAQLKAALARLQVYEDEADYLRAEQLGVAEAVRASGLPSGSSGGWRSPSSVKRSATTWIRCWWWR